jgi:hypothetical protein
VKFTGSELLVDLLVSGALGSRKKSPSGKACGKSGKRKKCAIVTGGEKNLNDEEIRRKSHKIISWHDGSPVIAVCLFIFRFRS